MPKQLSPARRHSAECRSPPPTSAFTDKDILQYFSTPKPHRDILQYVAVSQTIPHPAPRRCGHLPRLRPRRISPAARGKHIHTASSGEGGQTFSANPDSKRPNWHRVTRSAKTTQPARRHSAECRSPPPTSAFTDKDILQYFSTPKPHRDILQYVAVSQTILHPAPRRCGHLPRLRPRHCPHLECGKEAETAKESLNTKTISSSGKNITLPSISASAKRKRSGNAAPLDAPDGFARMGKHSKDTTMQKLSIAPFRAAKKTERKVSKGKDKETYPGYFSNPLRSAR